MMAFTMLRIKMHIKALAQMKKAQGLLERLTLMETFMRRCESDRANMDPIK